MKKLMIATFAGVALVACAHCEAKETTVVAPVEAVKTPSDPNEIWAKKCNMTVEAWKALSKKEQQAKKAVLRAAAKSAQDNRMAKKCGISVEEWQKLSADEQKAKIAETKAAALKKEADFDVAWAKRLGITVEDWNALSTAEQKAKRAEWKSAQRKK